MFSYRHNTAIHDEIDFRITYYDFWSTVAHKMYSYVFEKNNLNTVFNKQKTCHIITSVLFRETQNKYRKQYNITDTGYIYANYKNNVSPRTEEIWNEDVWEPIKGELPYIMCDIEDEIRDIYGEHLSNEIPNVHPLVIMSILWALSSRTFPVKDNEEGDTDDDNYEPDDNHYD